MDQGDLHEVERHKEEREREEWGGVNDMLLLVLQMRTVGKRRGGAQREEGGIATQIRHPSHPVSRGLLSDNLLLSEVERQKVDYYLLKNLQINPCLCSFLLPPPQQNLSGTAEDCHLVQMKHIINSAGRANVPTTLYYSSSQIRTTGELSCA